MLIQNIIRILFFTGKGGVGRTSSACATAIGLADAGKRVLLVSTDPASNLDEVLGWALTAEPKAVPGVPRLFALNIDPKQAAHDYRERVVGPYRCVLPAASVASIEEQLLGGCTMETAAFDEFSRLLGDAHATREFDHVLFDTAPTRHTLRPVTQSLGDPSDVMIVVGSGFPKQGRTQLVWLTSIVLRTSRQLGKLSRRRLCGLCYLTSLYLS